MRFSIWCCHSPQKPDEVQSASRTFMAQAAKDTMIPFDSGGVPAGAQAI